MALNNVGDIITEVLTRNNRTTTDGFITDTFLQGWIKDASNWATALHKWPFTEQRDQSTSWAGIEETAYSSLTVKYRTDSIRMLSIGGKRLRKLNFEDYQIFREEEPTGDDRVFSDFSRVIYINPYADVSGTLAVYGQYTPSLDVTDLTATTVFSTYDEEGNEAIVEKASSYLKRREHLTDEAELHDQRASVKLEEIWKRVQDEQAMYQTHPDRGGMFERFDVLQGRRISDEINENQF